MAFYDTIVVGAGCWSAGMALAGRKSLLIIDRGANVGAEYFDSYRETSDWRCRLDSAPVRELYRALDDRGAIRGGSRSDCYALAPFLYRALIPHHAAFRLWTEIESITPCPEGMELRLFDADGHDTVRCRTLIDTTSDCFTKPEFGRENIVGRRIAAVAITPDAMELVKSWQPIGGSVRMGRADNELVLTVTIAPQDGWTEARRKLLAVWQQRPEVFFRGSRIAAIGKYRQFDVREDDAVLGEHHFYFNSSRFRNPLAALDAGAATAKEI